MAMAAAQTPPPWRVWFGILGAPFAWTAEETLGWLLSSGSCPTGSPAGVGGTVMIPAARAILFVIGALALLVSLAALGVGLRQWRRSKDPAITSIHAYERHDFLAAVALLVSGVFTLAVILQSAVLFVLPPCQIMR